MCLAYTVTCVYHLQLVVLLCTSLWKWKSLNCVRLLATPWNFPGQNTGVGSLSLFRDIFPTQESNPCLPHCITKIWAAMIMATIGKWIKMENIWYSTTYKIPYLHWSKYITWDWLCLSLHRVKNLWNTCLSLLVGSSQYAFS